MTQTITTKILNRHGLKIAVQIDVPEQSKGLVFVMHGWKSSMQGASTLAVSHTVRESGFTTVCFDCTHSNGDSDGVIEKSTISTFINDLEDVVAWSKEQRWFQSPYILAGTSLGGITILEHTKAHTAEIKAIAPICTVISGNLSIEAAMRTEPDELNAWRDTGIKATTYGNNKSALFPWSHMEDRLRYNTLAYASQLTMPVFMCVGSNDTSCPPDHQQQLFDALGTKDKELHIIEGCPHRFQDPVHVEQLQKHMSRFLARICP